MTDGQQVPAWHVGPGTNSTRRRATEQVARRARRRALSVQCVLFNLFVSQAPVVGPQVLHWLAPSHVTPVQRGPQAPKALQLPGEQLR